MSYPILQDCPAIVLALPSVSTLNDWIKLIAAVLALPAAGLALYALIRYWKARIRKEGLDLAGLEKERAYLAAFQNYVNELNRPLGYSEREYTALEGVLVEQEHVELRYVFRKASAQDQKGLSPGDILNDPHATSVRNIDSILSRTRRPVVLLGEPGCGKSVTMRHLALEIARGAGAQAWPLLPVYVQLGNYHQKDNGRPGDFLEFIKYQLREVIPGGSNIVEGLQDALNRGRVFLLLDGMDEMPSMDFAARADEIKRFLIAYGNLDPIVIACRRREYTGAFPHSELIIEPFNARRVREYLEKHWELYAKDMLRPEGNGTSRENYFAIAQENHPLFPFATNPFSLKLLANYFFVNRGRLPPSQAEVFESYIDKKLDVEAERRKWVSSKAVSVLNIWKETAFSMIEGNLGTYTTATEAGDLSRPKKRSSKEIEDAFGVAVKSGLMRREADGSVRFEHHRLLEYLAASHWENAGESSDLTVDQLNNPWWRETLVLRGGITKNPNDLVQRVCRAIDRRYLRLLDLRFTNEPDRDVSSVTDLATLRLEGIVAIEVALACAKQRVSELDNHSIALLEPFAVAVANKGSLIEQVRLARSLKGLPLGLSHRALGELATSSSDWLVNDVFNAIDQKDYEDPRFAEIVNNFLRSTNTADLLTRLRAVKGLSLFSCWRLAQPGLRRGLLLTGLKLIGFGLLLVAMMALSLVFFNPERFTAESLTTRPGRGIALIAVVVMLALSIRMAGIGLTLFFAVCAVPSYWLLPPRTAFRIIFVLWWYGLQIGSEFQHAKWIRNPVVRFITLASGMAVWLRVFVVYILLQALIVYGVWLTTHGPSTWRWHLVGGLVGALLIETLVQFGYGRSTRELLARGATSLEPDELERFLDEYLARLRSPMPVRFSKQILNRIVEMPVDENTAIKKLYAFINREEFFVPRDNILEAIDRIHLRRRQKGIGE